MKLITYIHNSKEYVGIISETGGEVIPVENYKTMNELIDKSSIKELNIYKSEVPKEKYININEIELQAPIPEPKQDIICLGINYMEHAEESARFKKENFSGERKYAVYFSKRVNRACPPNGKILLHSDIVDSLDYESEFALIIGKDAENVKKEKAFDYIFGYTIINDISARNLQTRHNQWYFGKSLNSFTPMGPCIVTEDEFQRPPVLNISSKVNGELRQNNNTGNLLFDIPHVISELSSGMTLKAGTIISMGTPAGVGMGFNPPKFLKHGDIVECIVENIGTLKNSVE